ncbi:MAG: hypothetical protein JWL68_3670 [Actinomycetia bacterium]|nr:hypothetical protein [Actinomycetes bacterium]
MSCIQIVLARNIQTWSKRQIIDCAAPKSLTPAAARTSETSPPCGWLITHADGCVMRIGDSLDDGQAESGPVSLAAPVGGEVLEGLEEAVDAGCREG